MVLYLGVSFGEACDDQGRVQPFGAGRHVGNREVEWRRGRRSVQHGGHHHGTVPEIRLTCGVLVFGAVNGQRRAGVRRGTAKGAGENMRTQ